MLVPACAADSFPVKVSVPVAPLANDGIVHTPLVYDPMDGVPAVNPEGVGSFICMLVRGFVPWLVMVMVNVALLPTFRVFWLAVLVISGF